MSIRLCVCLYVCAWVAVYRSMFERLQQAGHPVFRLTTQYRMHPSISHYVNQLFYQNRYAASCRFCRFSGVLAVHWLEGLYVRLFHIVR